MSALNRALKRWGKADRIHIGSVKANIGHTDVVAGLAGLIKAALILRHGEVPPEMPIDTLNDLCRFEETPFDLAQIATELPEKEGPCAGISSFGIGGTNGHIIIEVGQKDFPLSSPVVEAGTRFDGILRKRNARRTDRASGGATIVEDDSGDGAAPETETILAILREHASKADISLSAPLQDLGIDSIGVVMITEELDNQFGHTLSAARFAELTTVADLIDAMRSPEGPTTEGGSERPPTVIQDVFLEGFPESSKLTLGQNRFFYPKVANPSSEMCASIMELIGTVLPAKVKAAIAKTILRHQALRSRYLQISTGQWSVHYDDYPADGYFRHVNMGPYETFDTAVYCDTVFSNVDFSFAPLFFAHMLQFEGGKCLLILFSHKVMLDGTSFRLMMNDFAAFYQDENPNLPSATPISIYAQYQNNWFETFDIEQDRAYWRRDEWALCGNLPVDQEAGIGGKTGEETEAREYVSVDDSAALLSRLKAHRVGLMDLILTAVSTFATTQARSDWTQMSCTFGGRSDVLGATGRDFSSTVGLLALNGLLLLQKPSGKTVLDRVEDMKHQLSAIPSKGLSYFIGSDAPVKLGVERVNVDSMPLYNRELTVNFHGYEGYNVPHIETP
ncbi:hypothetical protein MMB232_03252 (plasmid) [Brevundimonas subvibrioides]